MKPYTNFVPGRLSPAVSPLPMGQEPFPGCRLRQFRGRGAFGEVWEAEAPGGKRVALKFIPCDPTNAPREIRSLQHVRQIEHPNLIHIEKVLCCPGHLLVVMELAQKSLLDLLDASLEEAGAPLAPPLVCKYLSQVADVLDFMNARQHRVDGQLVAFRHCDVKPSNMLLFGETVKLTDFGITLMTATTSQSHSRCGTPDYAAPEVFGGKVTDRTDQYSLAISYYVLRTGKLPFHNTPPDFRRDYVRPAPDLTLVGPKERPILARAFSNAAMDRWPSCTEFMTHLTRAVQRTGRHRAIAGRR
jgi:serine/threonine protein kinase, bacterial